MDAISRQLANAIVKHPYAWEEYDNEPVVCVHCATRMSSNHGNIHYHADGCPVVLANRYADKENRLLIIIRGEMPVLIEL